MRERERDKERADLPIKCSRAYLVSEAVTDTQDT